MSSTLRHALRSLKRTPGFSITAVVTLVLGIAAATAMFSIVYDVLLSPLPYGNPERLVAIDLRSPELRHIQQPPGVALTFKREARQIADIGIYRTGSANITDATGASAAERLTATWVTASMIPTLQVSPILGRTFAPEEDRPNGPNVVVLSEGLWRTRFFGRTDVLGKTLEVNSVPREIIGVMPKRFEFPSSDTRLWLPARVNQNTTTVGDFTYAAVARLSRGATADGAQRELASVLPRVAALFPRLESGVATSSWLDDVKPVAVVVPLRTQVTGEIARTLWILAAAAVLVLLVACANVANLMLIRADGRQLELALREALGASRLRILTHFAGESAVLAGTAAVIAIAVTWAALRALLAFGPTDLPRMSELHVGLTTVGFAVLIAAVAAIACSAIPAFRIRRASLSFSLRDGGRNETSGKARQRLRGLIVTLQIAVALVVSAGSALLLRTFHSLYQERPGFDADHVTTFWMQLPFARYDDTLSVNFFARLTQSVGRLPGVRAAGVTTVLPLGLGDRTDRSFRVDGDGREVSLPAYTIGGGYFAAMTIPLLAGRDFSRIGVQRAGDVIVSRRAAETLWNDPTGASAVGRRLAMSPAGPSYTVIGVVGDVRDHDLATAPSATVYLPQAPPIDRTLEPSARHSMALVVKTSVAPTSIIGPVRQIVREIDPGVPTYNEQAMSDVVRASTARLSFMLELLGLAAVITLVLGAVGLYGVTAYMVALRTREFGVRVALGADPRRLARSVAVRGLTMIAGGVGAGLLLFAIAARFLRTLLYGVAASDPLTLAAATLAIVVIASVANWVPARRAAQVDPAIALRSD